VHGLPLATEVTSIRPVFIVKDSSYVDLALMSVPQKYIEKIERIERELS
jgi:hypothetical protein